MTDPSKPAAALPKSVGTVGAGNMAEAILSGLIRAGMRPDQLRAVSDDDDGGASDGR